MKWRQTLVQACLRAKAHVFQQESWEKRKKQQKPTRNLQVHWTIEHHPNFRGVWPPRHKVPLARQASKRCRVPSRFTRKPIQSNDDDVHCYMLQQKMPAPNLGRSPSLQRRSSPLNIMTSLCPVMRRSYPQNHVKSPEKKQTRQVKWLPFAVLDDFVFDLKLPFRLMEMMHFQSETLSEKEGWGDAWCILSC